MDIDPIKNILLCSINKLLDIIPRLLGTWPCSIFFLWKACYISNFKCRTGHWNIKMEETCKVKFIFLTYLNFYKFFSERKIKIQFRNNPCPCQATQCHVEWNGGELFRIIRTKLRFMIICSDTSRLFPIRLSWSYHRIIFIYAVINEGLSIIYLFLYCFPSLTFRDTT